MSTPLPRRPSWLTVPVSWGYRTAMAWHNARFNRPGAAASLNRPVISVGNLTTGGVGKTPMVAWIVDRLLEAGHRPVIGMRGYGARDGGPSDEQAEYGQRLPGTPVVADPDRRAALSRFLAEHADIDCVVLDDGFQHRRLRRDLDIVLIDASRNTFAEPLLPAGHLREPVRNLRRADCVVMTHATGVDPELRELVQRSHGEPPIAWTRHAWTRLRCFEAADEPAPRDAGWLCGRHIVTMLGIGNPRPVHDALASLGAIVQADVPARDHEHYTAARMHRVRERCDDAEALFMTGKDWVKVRDLIDLSSWPVPVVVPDLRLEFQSGEETLRSRVLQAVATDEAPRG